jgi:hypothetical protein
MSLKPESLDANIDQRLERGELVLFERCPFPLPEGEDLRYLQSWTLDGHAKAISLFPDSGVMGGQRASSEEDRARLKGLLGEFSREATRWLARTLPRYARAWRFGPLRFRVAEERGREFDPKLSGAFLHVDANSDMPAHGDSFLRLFVNLNPDESREWRTSSSLGALLDVWGDRVRDPREARPPLAERLRLRHGRSLGLELPKTSPYDELMMRLHFFGKTDEYLQHEAPKTHWVFPPRSAWLVYSDLVSHAVVGGRFAIDQTYLVPSWAFRDPERSTRAVIDRYWSGRRAEPPGDRLRASG